jgi:hypothetical protein
MRDLKHIFFLSSLYANLDAISDAKRMIPRGRCGTFETDRARERIN